MFKKKAHQISKQLIFGSVILGLLGFSPYYSNGESFTHNLKTQRYRLLQTLDTPVPVVSVRFTVNGDELAAILSGGQVRVWECFDFSKSSFYHVDDQIWSPGAIFENVARLPVSGLEGYKAAADGSLGFGFELSGHNFSFSEEGAFAAEKTPSRGRFADIYETANWKKVGEIRSTTNINGLSFSPDGTRIAVGENDGVAIWDRMTQQVVQKLTFPYQGSRFDIRSKFYFITSLAYSGDGKYLAAASFSRVFLWDLEQSLLVNELSGHKGVIYSIKFSRDNSVLATASQDKSAKIWDVATGQLLESLEHKTPVRDVAFSPDQTTLATASFFEDFIRIWKSRSNP